MPIIYNDGWTTQGRPFLCQETYVRAEKSPDARDRRASLEHKTHVFTRTESGEAN